MSDTNDRVSEAVEKYGNLIRRICFLNLRNKSDLEDVFQEVFLKLLLHEEPFENEEHTRAWLCRVTFNLCKDLHKSFWHSRVGSLEEMDIPYDTPEQSELIPAVLALPADWKEVIYLHFYEEMTIPQIAGILGKNTNTVYTILRRAKVRLRGNLEEDFLHGRL
ncbi:MAG: sigma-70 family RNA polymerase sigma factor [Saccharofermentanales bacterium]